MSSDLENAWQIISSSSEWNMHTTKELSEAMQILINEDVVEALELDLMSKLEKSVKKDLVTLITGDVSCDFCNLVRATYHHADQHKDFLTQLTALFESAQYPCDIGESFIRIYRTNLEMHYHHKISKMAEEFYLKAFPSNSKDADTSYGENSYTGCSSDDCESERIKHDIAEITSQVQQLGLFQDIIEETLFVIVRSQIKEHVVGACSGTFSKHLMADQLQWLNDRLISWLEKVTYNLKSSEILCKERLLYYLYDSFVRLRLEEMLPMIIDYPESKSAFEDLHAALPHTNLRRELIRTVKQVYENRILHPGVTTTDILTAYVQSIQALRVLDPSCVILEIVTEPVKQYLRSRDDTVRCIVSNLIDDSCDVLSEELTKGTTDQDIIDEDNICDDWQNWQPDPVDANPAVSSKTRRSTDIINMLVNIYGTKELFIKEYWNLLADRLLSNLSYSTLWEIRYFELLKIRFGETDLHKCEVMLKDVADSKRLNVWINDELQKDEEETQIPFQMNAMILSAQYWPSFREEKIDLPDEMKSALEKYTKAYEITKVNRTLKWEPHIGQVEIDIEMDSGSVTTYKTSPVNVAIIMAFQEKDTYTVDELAEKLQASTSVIRRRAAYWQSHGVLKEEITDTYKLNKEHVSGPVTDVVEEEEVESATASAEQQKEEELQMMWTYINGMLTNMDSQTLERIHSMLKMFANTECTIHELEKFLSRKIREGKLMCAGGVYKLVT